MPTRSAGLISQGINVTAGTLILTKPLFGEIIVRETLGKKISWNPDEFKLVHAFMRIAADQDVQSGASLTVNHNDRRLNPVIRWESFDTNEKKQIYDVSDLLTNGENIFDFVYEVSGLHQQSASCKIDAFISLEFESIKGGYDSSPAQETRSEDKQYWSKLWTSITNNIKLIVALLGIGAIISAIGYLIYKRNSFMLKLLGKFMRK
jgi:hypothetical protein